MLSPSFSFSGPTFPPQDSSLHLYLHHTARGPPFPTPSPQASKGPLGGSGVTNPHLEGQAHQEESSTPKGRDESGKDLVLRLEAWI